MLLREKGSDYRHTEFDVVKLGHPGIVDLFILYFFNFRRSAEDGVKRLKGIVI